MIFMPVRRSVEPIFYIVYVYECSGFGCKSGNIIAQVLEVMEKTSISCLPNENGILWEIDYG